MKLIKLLIVVSLISCSTFQQSNKELLVGKWTYQSITDEDDLYHRVEALGEFKENGLLFITISGFMRVADKEVFFKIYDRSKWNIVDDIYTEETIEMKLIEIKGDHKLQQIIKESYLSRDENSSNRGKIVQIDTNVCILSRDSENGEKEIIKLMRLK